MPNYTKLFNSIITSTIWTEDDRTRIVWITMLALSDQHGEIHASVPGLARVAGVGVNDVEAAVEKFLSPDKYSRTPDHDGRRILEIDGGWMLLNHEKYRKMASKEDAKEAAAERQRRKRRLNDSVTVERDSHGSVTPNRDIAEAEAEADTIISSPSETPSSGDDVEADSGKIKQAFDSFWAAYPRKVGKRKAEQAWQTATKQKRLPEISAVVSAIECGKRSKQWSDPSLIPHPTTWINRDGWEDEYEQAGVTAPLRGVRPRMEFDAAGNNLDLL